MERSVTVERMLSNFANLHELGRQRAFELGNPYYARFEEDGGYYRKELPTGEIFLVAVEFINDDKGHPVRIVDTIIKELEAR